jgi:hypothetical protein
MRGMLKETLIRYNNYCLFCFSGLRGILTESNKQKWQNGIGKCCIPHVMNLSFRTSAVLTSAPNSL